MSSLRKQRLRKTGRRQATARVERHKRDQSAIRAYSGLDGRAVKVGLPKGAGTYPEGTPVISVGVWNEFGTSMIPARSFLRSGIRKGNRRLRKVMAFAAAQAVDGKITPEQATGLVGQAGVDLVKARIISVSTPPNAPSTLAAKLRKGGKPRPLQDTGLLRQSITFETFKKKGGSDE